jgi:hypothetical protein
VSHRAAASLIADKQRFGFFIDAIAAPVKFRVHCVRHQSRGPDHDAHDRSEL